MPFFKFFFRLYTPCVMDRLRQASSVSPTVKRQSSQRSFVWNYFTQVSGKLETCSEFRKDFTETGGTTNLTRHLKDRHNIFANSSASADQDEKPPSSRSSRPLDQFVLSRTSKP
eukprot:scpid84234/ scgid35180/ 